METLTAKLDGTTRHLIQEGGAFFSRTRDAGEAFVAETGKAGSVFVRAARAEARAWTRYLRSSRKRVASRKQVAQLGPALERKVLNGVDAALGAVGERVRARLVELEPPAPRRAPAKAKPRRARRARPAAPPVARTAQAA